MNFNMNKGRIESFSDGVIAIVITIMVLQLHIPQLKEDCTSNEVWDAIYSIVPKLFDYLLSFVVISILWLNHHSSKVSGRL